MIHMVKLGLTTDQEAVHMYAYEHMRLNWNNGKPAIETFWRAHVEPVPENERRQPGTLTERQQRAAVSLDRARAETDARNRGDDQPPEVHAAYEHWRRWQRERFNRPDAGKVVWPKTKRKKLTPKQAAKRAEKDAVITAVSKMSAPLEAA